MKTLFLSFLSISTLLNLSAQNADKGYQKLQIGAPLAPMVSDLQPEPMAVAASGNLFPEDNFQQTNWATYTGKAEIFGLDYSTFHTFLPMAPPVVQVESGKVLGFEYELDDRAIDELRPLMEAEYGKAREVMATRYNAATNADEQVLGELHFPAGAKTTLVVYLVHPDYNEQTATVVFSQK